MLKPRKKLTRQEIKQDKFVTWVVRASALLQERTRQLAIGAAAVLLAVVVGVSLQHYSKRRSATAQALIAEAELARRLGRAPAEIAPLYQQVIDKYGNTRTAPQARIWLGEAKLATGDTDAARTIFEQYLRKHKTQDPLLHYAAWAGIGASLENDGTYLEAGEHHRAFAQRYPHSAYAPLALLDSARCLELAGQFEQAREALQRILDDYEETSVAQQARSQLRVL